MKFSKLLLLALLIISMMTVPAFCEEQQDQQQEEEQEAPYPNEEDAEELHDVHDDEFTRESFFAEYDKEESDHPEVHVAKKFFPTRETTIDKERFIGLLKLYTDGTVHDEEIDEDIREEAHRQIQEWCVNFMNEKYAEQEQFTIEDLFRIMFDREFLEWVELNHPLGDQDIEPDL